MEDYATTKDLPRYRIKRSSPTFPKLHVGFALEHRLQGSNAWPTVALGGRYVHGFSTIFTTENNDYGSFLTNLYGFSSQFDLTWSW